VLSAVFKREVGAGHELLHGAERRGTRGDRGASAPSFRRSGGVSGDLEGRRAWLPQTLPEIHLARARPHSTGWARCCPVSCGIGLPGRQRLEARPCFRGPCRPKDALLRIVGVPQDPSVLAHRVGSLLGPVVHLSRVPRVPPSAALLDSRLELAERSRARCSVGWILQICARFEWCGCATRGRCARGGPVAAIGSWLISALLFRLTIQSIGPAGAA
jgi:hypothetical protein